MCIQPGPSDSVREDHKAGDQGVQVRGEGPAQVPQACHQGGPGVKIGSVGFHIQSHSIWHLHHNPLGLSQ